jgi:WD40 repeat protein
LLANLMTKGVSKSLTRSGCADQRRAVSGADDGTIRLWDVESGRCLRVLDGNTKNILSVEWSADARWILSGGGAADKTVRLWDVKTGHCLCALKGHAGGIWSIAWSAEQQHAFSGDDAGGILK